MTKLAKRFTDDQKREMRAHKSVLANATPAQIEEYIETTVTDLNSAKEVIKQMAVLLSKLTQRSTTNVSLRKSQS